MGYYRAFLLNDQRKIVATHVIEAADDADAKVIAAELYDAISDFYSGLELWWQARRLGGPSWSRVVDNELTERRQEQLLNTEETLRESNAALAQSRRLIKRIERLRSA